MHSLTRYSNTLHATTAYSECCSANEVFTDAQYRAIDALENSIKQLHETKDLQRNTFSKRAVTFAEILDACERLRGDVGAEAEEGRRRALLEMELEGETEQQSAKSKLDPNAAAFEPGQAKKGDLEEGEEDEE